MRFSSPETFWFLLLIPLLCVFFAWATLARRKALLRFVGWPLAEKLTRDFSRRRQFGKYALFGIGTLWAVVCLLYTSPSPRDLSTSRMPSSA